jgi:peptidoglycan hydrolase CwlO-like protein
MIENDPPGETTGKFRIIVREEIETKVNGSLDRLERAVRWLKFGLWFIGGSAALVIGFDHWINSLAKKSELEELTSRVAVMSSQISALTNQLSEISKELKQPPKKIKWSE